MDKIIPAGYMIEVTTWENDGDNYQTETAYGLNEIDARIVVEYCELFTCDDGGDFGNSDVADKMEEAEMALAVIQAKQGITKVSETKATSSLFWKLVGTWGDGEYYRVVEYVKTYYVPEEIRIESVTFE